MRAGLVVRVAQQLARASDEQAVASVTTQELLQVAGTNATAVYLTPAEADEPGLQAQAGAVARAAWSRPPPLIGRVARSGAPSHGTIADAAWLKAAGVAAEVFFATPLASHGAQLGVLVVACQRASQLDRTALSTVADLAGAALATLRRLAASADEARRDPLTGLPNKRAFRELLGSALEAEAPADACVSLVLFDVDDFKRINDTHGHPAGDRVLRQVARVAQRALRSGEEAFRVGGEEFAIVVLEPIGVAARVAERVRQALAESTREALPTISAGVAAMPSGGAGVDALLATADAALYEAKRAGKNRVVVSGKTRKSAAGEQSGERAQSELRSVALIELRDVTRSWLQAEDTRTRDGALVTSCRYIATAANATGATISLIAGSRLVAEARWFDPALERLACTAAPILTRVTEVPLPGAPRVLRAAAAGHAEADLSRLLEHGASSALMLGARADGTALGVVEVYAHRPGAFNADEIQLASLAVRQVSALLVQRRHAEVLRQRYRASVISLSAAASGTAELRAELGTVGRLCRAVAEGCDVGRRLAFACELAGVLVTASAGDRRLYEAFATSIRPQETTHHGCISGERLDPLAVAAKLIQALGMPLGHVSQCWSGVAAIVDTVLAYRQALHRHGGDASARSAALTEIVEEAGTRRPPQPVEVLIRVEHAAGERVGTEA